MAHQAPVNRMQDLFGDSLDGPESGVPLQGARRLGAHVIELCELQARLLVADTKAASRRLLWFAILGIVGSVALLGAVPVALGALGLYLAAEFGWSTAGGLSFAAGIAVVVGAILLLVAVAVVRAGIAKFDRSAAECRQNLEMLKELVSRSPEPAEQEF